MRDNLLVPRGSIVFTGRATSAGVCACTKESDASPVEIIQHIQCPHGINAHVHETWLDNAWDPTPPFIFPHMGEGGTYTPISTDSTHYMVSRTLVKYATLCIGRSLPHPKRLKTRYSSLQNFFIEWIMEEIGKTVKNTFIVFRGQNETIYVPQQFTGNTLVYPTIPRYPIFTGKS